jgi:hypothetical protein
LPVFSDIISASFRRLAPAGDADYITEDLALRVVQILGVSRASAYFEVRMDLHQIYTTRHGGSGRAYQFTDVFDKGFA